MVFVGAVMLVCSAWFFVDAIGGYALVVVLAGIAWTTGGYRRFRIVLPLCLLMVFAIPLPYRLEIAFRLPLQRVATIATSWTLNAVGVPAIAESNIILLNDDTLEVAQACSGLRMFYGVLALAAFHAITACRPTWQRVIIILSALPIAIMANVARITFTGVLYELSSSDMARDVGHDFAGYLMIPTAVVLFFVVLWYLDRVWVPVRKETRPTLFLADSA